MHPQEASDLAEGLRELYCVWEQDYERAQPHFTSGICLALNELRLVNPNLAYDGTNEILGQCENDWAEYGQTYLEDYSSYWANGARATMCLFMAEWIESELLS